MNIIKRFRLRGVTFPIGQFQRPSLLIGQDNGKLDPGIMRTWTDSHGRDGKMLAGTVLDSWVALVFAARVEYGADLTFTSPADTFRSYQQQENGFRNRFTTVRIPTTDKRMWNGQWWYKKPGVAGMAVPGTSNHGWACAIDHAIWLAGKLARPVAWLQWLAANEVAYGWTHEAPSEDWHIRFVNGDTITPATALVQAALRRPTLTKRSVGSDVKAWQAIVGATPDGQFGPKTEALTVAWQNEHKAGYKGLVADGRVGPESWWVASR